MKASKIFPFSILIILLASISCMEDFEDMNKDPNRLTEIDPEFLFTNAIRRTFRDNNSTLHYRFCGQYSHAAVGTRIDKKPDEYIVITSENLYNDIFNGIYGGGIRYSNEVLRLTSEDGDFENELRYAMADVISVVNYGRLTDAFGDVPYFEGGWGQLGFLKPRYDSQEEIYTDLLVRLKKDIETIKNGDPENGFPGADPIYDNDLDKWVRFANSLRFRLAMRIRHVAPTLAQTVINECMMESFIEENDQNATFQNYDKDDGGLYNPWFGTWEYMQFKAAEKFVEYMKSTNDPRLGVFITQNASGEYIGMPNGLSEIPFSDWDKPNTSTFTAALVGRDVPLFLMTCAEIWFLRAEASLYGIGLSAGNENQYYQLGIRKSLEQWNIPESEIIQFLDEPSATLTGTQEQQFEQIGNQIWVAFTPNFVEAYANIRRTGYPVIPRRTEPTYLMGHTDGILPARIRYPVEEELNNSENLKTALKRQGINEIPNLGDVISTPVWWDVR